MFKGLFSILRRFITPYKRYIALNVLFNILTAFFTLFSFALIIPILEMLFGVNQQHYEWLPVGSASLKDVVVNDFYCLVQDIIAQYGPSNALACIALGLVVLTGIKVGTAYLAAWNMIAIRTGVVRDIRNQIYSKIVSLPIAFFQGERKGDVMNRMSGDVTEVENSIMSSLDLMFKNPIMIVVCLTTMILVSWQLTVFVLVLLPVAGFVMGSVGKRLKRVSLDVQNQLGALLSNIEETIGGLRIIKAFNAEDKVRKRFGQENETFRATSRRMQRRYELAHPMSEFLGTATIAIVLWFGGTLILGGDSTITASSFIYYMVIFYSIINPAKDLSKASYAIQRGMASMQRIDKILLAENNVTEPEHPVQLGGIERGITYDHVSFSYNPDGAQVLNDVSLDIPRGATVALVGQSGSGKTTMADLLPRFWDVTGGSISIDGVDIRDVSKTSLRALMGNVNQEAILFNTSIRDNITFGVDGATQEQIEHAARIANAHEFIMATEQGYDTNIGDRGSKLSGGQRQRLSIARAILKNPPILILDEATSALDTESEHLVQEALEHLMSGRTTLVIAHRLSTIKNADLICVMQDGRIVEQGTHDQLLAAGGAYKHLVDMQSF